MDLLSAMQHTLTPQEKMEVGAADDPNLNMAATQNSQMNFLEALKQQGLVKPDINVNAVVMTMTQANQPITSRQINNNQPQQQQPKTAANGHDAQQQQQQHQQQLMLQEQQQQLLQMQQTFIQEQQALKVQQQSELQAKTYMPEELQHLQDTHNNQQQQLLNHQQQQQLQLQHQQQQQLLLSYSGLPAKPATVAPDAPVPAAPGASTMTYGKCRAPPGRNRHRMIRVLTILTRTVTID